MQGSVLVTRVDRYIELMRRLVAVCGIAFLAFAGTACGNDNEGTGDPGGAATPEAALAGLAAAVNDMDDEAAAAFVCAKDRDYGTNMADSLAAATEADPRLRDMHYRATAGPVVEQTETTAVGSLEHSVVGIPDGLSEAGQQHLQISEIAWPMSLQTQELQLHLIVEDGRWVACRPVI